MVTNNSDIYQKVFQLHDHGRDTQGEVKSWGRNSRLDNLQAAILSKNFQKHDLVIKRRREIASIYNDELKGLEELTLPPGPIENADNFDVYQNYELQANNREHLRQEISNKGIGTIIQWGGKAIHQWEVLGFNIKLPKTERFFERCFMLPINMFVSDEDIYYICETIKNFYRR